MERRRDIRFDRLDEVIPEVERLLKGHTTSGTWSLGQILHHLATGIELSFGNSPVKEASNLDPELTRTFEARRRRFFKAGKFPEGAEVPRPSLIPPPESDDKSQVERLRSTLLDFESFEGTFQDHPYLGPLPKPEWAAFHLIHCAHHLSFVQPIG
jgi:hypothetical protein